MKYFFTANRRLSDHTYAHAYIALYTPAAFERSCPREFVEMQWQSDTLSRAHWYGPHAEARSDWSTGFGGPEQFAAIGRLLKQVPLCDSPIDYAAKLVAAGVERKFYDCRVSRFLSADEIQAPEYRRWMACDATGQCRIAVIACSENDAKIYAMKEFGKQLANEYGMDQTQAALSDWVSRGKEMRLDTRAVAPDLEPLERLWVPLGIPEAAAVA